MPGRDHRVHVVGDEIFACEFEVNPSPGFTYYDTHTGHRIGDAIASYLMGG